MTNRTNDRNRRAAGATEGVILSSGTYMLVVESDANGRYFFVPDPDRPEELVLGKSFGSTRMGIVHGSRVSYLIDPETSALRAVLCRVGEERRVVPFGAAWGQWIDDKGRSHVVRDPIKLLSQPSLQFNVDDAGEVFSLAFHANPNHAEAFSRNTRRRFMPGNYVYQIALDYQIPTGRLIRSQVVLRFKDTDAISHTYHIPEFPLVWPRLMKFDENKHRAKRDGSAVNPMIERVRAAKALEAAEAAAAGEPGEGAGSESSAGPLPKKVKRVKKVKRIRKVRKVVRSKEDGMGPSSTASEPRPKPRSTPKSDPPPRPTNFGFMGKAPEDERRAAPKGGGAKSASKDTNENGNPPSGAYGMRAEGSFIDPLGRKKSNLEPSGDSSRDQKRKPVVPTKLKPKPIPGTRHLETRDLVELVQSERDNARQWQMIEPNLMLGRAERTYGLIANFAELITERTPSWSPARLKAAFADQPGAILIGVMEQWTVNQVLAVAEINSESAKIMEWLREREIDRLLRIDVDREIANAVQARSALRVDRSADHPTIRKTWRILLQFLNADHGRRDERAIHRRKDEIAKHLQEARDFLMKVGL